MMGLYPQYRAVRKVCQNIKTSARQHLYLFRTILIGCGAVGGDWKKDHKNNKKKLYIIEPVVESLLQVILYFTYNVFIFKCTIGFLPKYPSLHSYWVRRVRKVGFKRNCELLKSSQHLSYLHYNSIHFIKTLITKPNFRMTDKSVINFRGCPLIMLA